MFNLKQMSIKGFIMPSIFASLTMLLTACGDSSYDVPAVVEPPAPTEYQYKVTVSNLTNAQPFSPVAVLLHSTGDVWTLGQPASLMLETLAESGDLTSLVGADFVIANATNNEVLLSGGTTELMISSTDSSASLLSLATMLVNTNDAFTGLNRIDLSGLAVDEMLNFKVAVYDAGTEANSESAGTIPGPADGGEGFNSARDDVDFVSRHSGVVTSDDGLNDSILNNQHKFDNPAMSVNIVRMQ